VLASLKTEVGTKQGACSDRRIQKSDLFFARELKRKWRCEKGNRRFGEGLGAQRTKQNEAARKNPARSLRTQYATLDRRRIFAFPHGHPLFRCAGPPRQRGGGPRYASLPCGSSCVTRRRTQGQGAILDGSVPCLA
jgi:hypothetical protein